MHVRTCTRAHVLGLALGAFVQSFDRACVRVGMRVQLIYAFKRLNGFNSHMG